LEKLICRSKNNEDQRQTEQKPDSEEKRPDSEKRPEEVPKKKGNVSFAA